jgi:Tfp pilus assembly protein FimV
VPSGRVRLTRRGRLLLVALAAASGVLVAAAVGSLGGDAGDGLELAGARSVVVQPGDTLWTIAASVATGEDVRAVVDELREANDLQSTTLVPGQVLTLP